jgi:hypothetical protein
LIFAGADKRPRGICAAAKMRSDNTGGKLRPADQPATPFVPEKMCDKSLRKELRFPV